MRKKIPTELLPLYRAMTARNARLPTRFATQRSNRRLHGIKSGELYFDMVTKLFLLQFVLFVRYFVKLAQNDFRRSRATPQSFCWLSSSRTKSPKFRLKIVL